MIRGKLSIRDEKAPQIVADSAEPMEQAAARAAARGTGREHPNPAAVPSPAESPVKGSCVAEGRKLYLRLPSEADPRWRRTQLILSMFPGTDAVVCYFTDTKLRRGTRAVIRDAMLDELRRILGGDSVVLK